VCTTCTFGFHRRFVRTCECDTDFPNPGPFAHTSQTALTAELLDTLTISAHTRTRTGRTGGAHWRPD
jgi:hypothetical protein